MTSPRETSAHVFSEGDTVTIDLFGRTTDALIKHVYPDGGYRLKAGVAVWLYLPSTESLHHYLVEGSIDE